MFQKFEVHVPEFHDAVYDITDYGAVGDGVHSNTGAFRKAMEAAAKTGGHVLVPDGIWMTGPICLKSGVDLHLSDNALIVFDKNPEEYPVRKTDYEGTDRLRAVSPIHAENAENIAITGKGVIDGSGHLWRPVKRMKVTKKEWKALLGKSPYTIPGHEGEIWLPSETIYEGQLHGEISTQAENAAELAAPYYDLYRPVMVRLDHCRRVLIENVTLQNSPAWCVHPFFCEDLTVRGVTVYNPYYAQNGDGIDVESCRNVEIAYSEFNVGDDGICIKSGKNKEARKIPGPSENIYIHHCHVGHSHGGFVVGSEMSRGVRNILVEDCTFTDTDVGLRFKSAIPRGGVVEDIYIRRVNMLNIKEQAAILTMNYILNTNGVDEAVVGAEGEEDIPVFRDIFIEDCNCLHARQAVKIQGLKREKPAIYNIRFRNFNCVAEEENVLEDCSDVVFEA
ncbi:MAG: glycoside hydrolase family 28 protein [Lachnospiraceae bacterium]|nr:glycoside hydrolase family 28 protein [Lachnospiraceae bacterium]